MIVVKTIGLAVLLFFSTFCAGQEIYRCTVDGKTTLSDRPCASGARAKELNHTQSKESTTSISTADYGTLYGEWRGQTQFQATAKGQRIGEAHNVASMVLKVDKDGKVTGGSAESGCRALGISAPSVAPTVLSLDISFSGCRYVGYNRRFSGTLALYPKNRHAQLRLMSIAPLQGQQFDVKATMRR